MASPHVDAGIVRDYLTHLAVRQHVSASTQNQALCALLCVCRDVIGFEPDGLASTIRARRGIHLPVVLSVTEVAALLEAIRGIPRLMATLIYGGGLRVSECCELRVKDIDFDQGLIHVRGGKGDKAGSGSFPARPCRSIRGQASCVDIRQIQEYLGHANVETTMIYTHVVKELRNPARSPADLLEDHLRQQK